MKLSQIIKLILLLGMVYILPHSKHTNKEKNETELNMTPQHLQILNHGPINKTRFDARTGSARLI